MFSAESKWFRLELQQWDITQSKDLRPPPNNITNCKPIASRLTITIRLFSWNKSFSQTSKKKLSSWYHLFYNLTIFLSLDERTLRENAWNISTKKINMTGTSSWTCWIHAGINIFYLHKKFLFVHICSLSTSILDPFIIKDNII